MTTRNDIVLTRALSLWLFRFYKPKRQVRVSPIACRPPHGVSPHSAQTGQQGTTRKFLMKFDIVLFLRFSCSMHNEVLRRKIHACWLGKAVGGTLGTPHEGKMALLDLNFYDPVPTGILPNDDLDLQLVWLHHLRRRQATRVTPELMAEAWREHVRFPFDEYAVCLRNQELGLTGSAVGAFDNWFGECMGAAIRSEIWACIAPGEPERAAGFAWSDAVCDHCGEGVWAEVFFAALQSAAFVENDVNVLLDRAESLLPAKSRVRRVSADIRRWWALHQDVGAVRDLLISRYAEANFTDVKVNVGFTLLGWLAGEGDFGRSLCLTTNCGYDTDCTAATLGALLGILNPDGISAEWTNPIGSEIVYSTPIIGIVAPATLEQLTEWTLELRSQLSGDRPAIREVAEHRPSAGEDTLAPIPLQFVHGAPPEPFSEPGVEAREWQALEIPGHWMTLPTDDGSGTLLRLAFDVPASSDLLAMAFSREATRVWLDGSELSSVAPDPTCPTSSAPSFHRGGRCVFACPDILPGTHDLLIWVASGGNEPRELVFGLADAASRLWLSAPWNRQPLLAFSKGCGQGSASTSAVSGRSGL